MIVVDALTEAPILRATRQAVPEMRMEVEAEQNPDSGPTRLLFWASGGEYDAFDQALADDPTVTDSTVLADTGERRLYRVVYTDEGMGWTAHEAWTAVDATLVSAEMNADGCAVRMRYPDREAFEAVLSWFDEMGLEFRLIGILKESAFGEAGLGPNLTDKQKEALFAAWREGYFDVPRGTELVELADELGVSDTAASQRIRRGIDTILEYHFEHLRHRELAS